MEEIVKEIYIVSFAIGMISLSATLLGGFILIKLLNSLKDEE